MLIRYHRSLVASAFTGVDVRGTLSSTQVPQVLTATGFLGSTP
jgi:hypothetical protein